MEHHKPRWRKERKNTNNQERHRGNRQRHSITDEQDDSRSRRKHNHNQAVPSEYHTEALPERALSGEDDYVRKWLAQTKDEAYLQDVEYGTQQKKSGRLR